MTKVIKIIGNIFFMFIVLMVVLMFSSIFIDYIPDSTYKRFFGFTLFFVPIVMIFIDPFKVRSGMGRMELYRDPTGTLESIEDLYDETKSSIFEKPYNYDNLEFIDLQKENNQDEIVFENLKSGVYVLSHINWIREIDKPRIVTIKSNGELRKITATKKVVFIQNQKSIEEQKAEYKLLEAQERKKVIEELLFNLNLITFNKMEEYRETSQSIDNSFNSFISHSTLKYDNSIKDTEDIREYSRRLQDFSAYINLTSELGVILPSYIEHKKIDVYADLIKENIFKNIDINNEKIEEVVLKYFELYGVNAYYDHNINALSKITNQEKFKIKLLLDDIKVRVKNEKERRKTESYLFGSNISEQTNQITYMNGFEFEDFLEKFFNDMGYKTETLPYTGDYGADLIVFWNHLKIIIQAKKYAKGNVTTPKAIQEAKTAEHFYEGDLSMVITTSHFTKNAIIMAEKTKVTLIDGEDFKMLLDQKNIYFSKLVSAAINN